MKSHIQLIRSVLDKFSYEDIQAGLPQGRKVNYLDMKTNTIKSEKIKTIGTKENYFSDYMEELLSKNVESPFCDFVRKTLKAFRQSYVSHKLKITAQDCVAIRKFFNVNLVRSERGLDLFNASPIVALVFGGVRQEHEMALHFSSRANPFDDYMPNIFINQSNTNLVIARNGVYCVQPSNASEQLFVFPISPKIAIVLISNKDKRKYLTNEGLQFATTNDDKVVDVFNNAAFEFEKYFNNGGDFIVGDEASLIRLKEINKKP